MAKDKRDRVRLIIDTDDVIRHALALRRIATPGEPSNSEIVTAILRVALAAEIAQAEKMMPKGEGPPLKKKRGRPPRDAGQDGAETEAPPSDG